MPLAPLVRVGPLPGQHVVEGDEDGDGHQRQGSYPDVGGEPAGVRSLYVDRDDAAAAAHPTALARSAVQLPAGAAVPRRAEALAGLGVPVPGLLLAAGELGTVLAPATTTPARVSVVQLAGAAGAGGQLAAAPAGAAVVLKLDLLANLTSQHILTCCLFKPLSLYLCWRYAFAF